MLPILFLSFALIYQLSTTSGLVSLDYYNAESDLNIMKQWYEMVKNPLDETSSMKQLDNEAKNTVGKLGSRMDVFLQRAIKSNKCVSLPGVSQAECLVVIMYTADDSNGTPFYREYNAASARRVWRPYQVYTTLLMSALQKLAKIDPIPPNAILYRGISLSAGQPSVRRIFWRTFTSASLDVDIAKGFAGPNGIILKFQPPASRYAAQVRKLSKYSDENEIILPPFIAFEFLDANGPDFYFNFKASKVQELLILNAKLFCGTFDWECLNAI